MFSSGHPDINALQLANILSIGFGSIIGDVKQPHEIDKIIDGSSFATQVCKALCIGEAVTPSGAKINTYGIGINIGYGSKLSGTRGVSASGSTMKKTKLILTP